MTNACREFFSRRNSYFMGSLVFMVGLVVIFGLPLLIGIFTWQYFPPGMFPDAWPYPENLIQYWLS